MSSEVASPVQPCPNKTPDKLAQDPKKKWLKFQVKDESGAKLQNVQLNILLPDGSHVEMCTDENGFVEINNIDADSCEINFDWKESSLDNALLLK